MFGTLQFPAAIASTLLLAFTVQALPKVHRLEARATIDLPTGWTDVGCVQDYSARILTGYVTSSSTMTPRICANTCRGLGFVSMGADLLPSRGCHLTTIDVHLCRNGPVPNIVASAIVGTPSVSGSAVVDLQRATLLTRRVHSETRRHDRLQLVVLRRQGANMWR